MVRKSNTNMQYCFTKKLNSTTSDQHAAFLSWGLVCRMAGVLYVASVDVARPTNHLLCTVHIYIHAHIVYIHLQNNHALKRTPHRYAHHIKQEKPLEMHCFSRFSVKMKQVAATCPGVYIYIRAWSCSWPLRCIIYLCVRARR